MGLWGKLLPGQTPPYAVNDAVHAIRGCLPGAGKVPNTAALVVLWVVWKSRNTMIFQGVNHDTATLTRHIQQHVDP